MACKYYINGLTLSREQFLDYVKKEPIHESSKVLGTSVAADAPFVKNTGSVTKLLLKHAIREAVKDGATKVTWEGGDVQFNRWGSEEIHWRKETAQPKGTKEWGYNVGDKYFKTEKEAKEYADSHKWSLLINEQSTGAEAFGITLEPAGGSKSPTMEQLYTLGKV